MTRAVRIVVANQPRLMRDLVVETLAEEPGVEIVAEVQIQAEIVQVVEGTLPDFLIIALDESNQRPPLCDLLLRRYPDMKILALAPERNCSVFFWASFDIHECPVESSEAGVLSAIHKMQAT